MTTAKQTTDQADSPETANKPESGRTRSILDNTVIFRIQVRKTSLIKKLTKAEKEMLWQREQAALLEMKQEKREEAEVEVTEPVADDEAEDADLEAKLAGRVGSIDKVRGSKELIDLDELRPIRALDAQYKASLKYMELKSPIVGGGAHLIPLPYVKELREETDRYILRRDELVGAFLEKYPELKAEQIAGDPELFKESDYPTVNEVRDSFDVSYEWKSDDVPAAKLRALSDVQLRKELEKCEDKWKNVGDEIMEALRAGLAELVSNAVDQLGSDDGKPKVFRDSLVKKVNRFIETFSTRNAIVGDTELPKMVEELRQAMQGVTPETLRKDETIRQTVQQAFSSVAAEMKDKNMIITRRRIIREDDDEE